MPITKAKKCADCGEALKPNQWQCKCGYWNIPRYSPPAPRVGVGPMSHISGNYHVRKLEGAE